MEHKDEVLAAIAASEDRVNGRLDKIQATLDWHTSELKDIRSTLDWHTSELKDIRSTLDWHTSELKDVKGSLAAIDRRFEQERRAGGAFSHQRVPLAAQGEN